MGDTDVRNDARAARVDGPSGGLVRVADLSNDALILRLHFTINHLSRWLSPVHNQTRLQRSPHRGEPAAKELVGRLRDEERVVYARMHAVARRTSPDLDALPVAHPTPEEERFERTASAMETVAEFRRLRQSTCSLLRSQPDAAWKRRGISRLGHDWRLRGLAEHLAEHDRVVLGQMDRALTKVGVRDEVATVSRVGVEELIRLAPTPNR